MAFQDPHVLVVGEAFQWFKSIEACFKFLGKKIDKDKITFAFAYLNLEMREYMKQIYGGYELMKLSDWDTFRITLVYQFGSVIEVAKVFGFDVNSESENLEVMNNELGVESVKDLVTIEEETVVDKNRLKVSAEVTVVNEARLSELIEENIEGYISAQWTDSENKSQITADDEEIDDSYRTLELHEQDAVFVTEDAIDAELVVDWQSKNHLVVKDFSNYAVVAAGLKNEFISFCEFILYRLRFEEASKFWNIKGRSAEREDDVVLVSSEMKAALDEIDVVFTAKFEAETSVEISVERFQQTKENKCYRIEARVSIDANANVDIDLVDKLFLRVCSNRRQMRYPKNWSFKFKRKPFLWKHVGAEIKMVRGLSQRREGSDDMRMVTSSFVMKLSFRDTCVVLKEQRVEKLKLAEEKLAEEKTTKERIGCWDLKSGIEQLRFKPCASTVHGLTAVGEKFLAAFQLRNASASSGSIFYWSWNKPQAEVKSFPVESIKALTANNEGTYIVGGGTSGGIYLWKVATGKLLKKWHGHYRSLTCLVFSGDDSLLVSGSQDASIRVWSLIRLFDDFQRQQGNTLYEHKFNEHTMAVTDIVIDYGGCNAMIVSASEDWTCKVWSLSKEKLLRNIVFPSAINSLALDSGGSVFYAGGRDSKIYIGAINATSEYGTQVLGSVSEQSKAVTCLAYCADGNLLISGSEDAGVYVWDPGIVVELQVMKP